MGAAWPSANFQLIDKSTEIAPGIFLIDLVSDKPGTLELHELSLAIRTPGGLVLTVGCSHPGVEHIIQEANAIDPHISILSADCTRSRRRILKLSRSPERFTTNTSWIAWRLDIAPESPNSLP